MTWCCQGTLCQGHGAALAGPKFSSTTWLEFPCSTVLSVYSGRLRACVDRGGIMIPKQLQSIREEDVQLVVSKAVPAGETIEYKRELPQTSLEEQEFLADVSSLANTLGGDVVFGVDHVQGIPSAVVGL